VSLDLSSVATSLLASLGSTSYVKLIRKTGGTFDPVTGTTTGEVITTILLKGIVTNIADNLIDGTRIKAGDKQVMFDNKETPTKDDLIEFGGIRYRVEIIDGFNHAGIQQYWKVVCRA